MKKKLQIISQFADDIRIFCTFTILGKCKDLKKKGINVIRNILHNLGPELCTHKKMLFILSNLNIRPGEFEMQCNVIMLSPNLLSHNVF